MEIKERERRVEVFLYGLFMDEELLRGKGLEPEGGEIAAIDGFALLIGQRAALFPTPGAKRLPKLSTSTYSSVRPIAGCIHADLRKREAIPADCQSLSWQTCRIQRDRHHCALRRTPAALRRECQ